MSQIRKQFHPRSVKITGIFLTNRMTNNLLFCLHYTTQNKQQTHGRVGQPSPWKNRVHVTPINAVTSPLGLQGQTNWSKAFITSIGNQKSTIILTTHNAGSIWFIDPITNVIIHFNYYIGTEIYYNIIWQINIICWKLMAIWLVGRFLSLVKIIVWPVTGRRQRSSLYNKKSLIGFPAFPCLLNHGSKSQQLAWINLIPLWRLWTVGPMSRTTADTNQWFEL